MPKRDSAPAGAPCWVDLFTSDPERTQAFYSELLGWKVEDPGPQYGGYKNFLKDDERVAGTMHNDGSTGQPDAWTVYLATDDAQATVDAAAAHGGQVFLPPMQVHELGTMAMMADPSGATIGIWQPAQHRGFGLLAEPGAPSWFELHTSGYDAAVQFYRDVFDWDTHTMSDEPEFRYTTLGQDEEALAGIMDRSVMSPAGVPSFWAVYFQVEDADAAVATIERLGGSIIAPATDTPYGRLAEVADPTGAEFRLQQP